MDTISDSMLAQQLRKMEEELLSRQVRASSDRLDVLLAEEFIEFGSSGVSYDKQAIIAALADTVNDEFLSLRDHNLIAHSDAIAVTTCVCECHDSENRLVRRSFRSSLWKKFDGRWQMAFHQGTKAE